MLGTRRSVFMYCFLCLLSKEKNHTKIVGGLIEGEERGERSCTVMLI